MSQGITVWKGVAIALWLLVAQFIVAIPAVIVSILLKGNDLTSEDAMGSVMGSSMGLVLVLSFPLAVWLVLRRWKINLSDLQWTRGLWAAAFSALLLTLGVAFVFGELLTHLPNYDSMLEKYGELFGQISPILLLLGGVLIGPVCEELIFRGVILKELLKSHPPATGIFFSALIFGVIHGIAIQILFAFSLGLVIGWVYYRTRSLWICIGLHVINNAIAFSSGDTDSTQLSDSLSGLSYVGILAGGVAAILLGIYLFNRLAPAAVSIEAPLPITASPSEEE